MALTMLQHRYLGWAICMAILWVGLLFGMLMDRLYPPKSQDVPATIWLPLVFLLPALVEALIVGYVISPPR